MQKNLIKKFIRFEILHTICALMNEYISVQNQFKFYNIIVYQYSIRIINKDSIRENSDEESL